MLTLALIRCPFHPRVTAVAWKRPRSFCQKCRWQVTPKHAYTLDPPKSDGVQNAIHRTPPTVSISSVQEGLYKLGEAHMLSMRSLKRHQGGNERDLCWSGWQGLYCPLKVDWPSQLFSMPTTFPEILWCGSLTCLAIYFGSSTSIKYRSL